ncbi:MAG: triphosphoribosyl-dephospho-CoA synthase CitG [Campylobacterales bacterium]|nr:triphosphoribosyl-dephospho-CoA synthase CitG [Campylobacterales bacterium]
MLTALAYEALIKEVELTPKPGLVDKANNGSHHDMSLETFYRSAKAIAPFVDTFLTCKRDFAALREAGKACECAMFEATKGINTHKGMIFSLAVICGAIGSVGYKDMTALQREIRHLCHDLVQHDLAHLKTPKTHGERFYLQTKATGIRGEAAAGYPTLFQQSLPFFTQHYKRYGEDMALKLTLLLLMSETQDSTLFARGGLEGLAFVQQEAKKRLHVRDALVLDEALNTFDEACIQRNLSPGGSADLLGLTWFLHGLG